MILKNTIFSVAAFLALLCTSCNSNLSNRSDSSGGSSSTNSNSDGIDPEYASAMASKETSETEREQQCRKIRGTNPYLSSTYVPYYTDGRAVDLSNVSAFSPVIIGIYNDSPIATQTHGNCRTFMPSNLGGIPSSDLPDDHIKIGKKYRFDTGTWWYRLEGDELVLYHKTPSDIRRQVLGIKLSKFKIEE